MNKNGNNKFEVCIVGTDFNAYFMARNFYEAYGIKSHLFGKITIGFTSKSKILDVTVVDNFWDKEVFVKTLVEFAKTQVEKQIILVGTNDRYVKMITENRSELSKYFLFNYASYELVTTLLEKDLFYTKFSNMGVTFPKTHIYSCLNGENSIESLGEKVKELGFPMILKPGDGIEFHLHEYESQAKVHKIKSLEQLHEIITKILKAGYTGNIVLQEYIPGGDGNLFDVVMYVSTKGTVEFMTFAQIGLQERAAAAIGNCTVLVNGFNEFGGTQEIVKKLKTFVEKIEYRGAGEIDIKYDERDKKFKVLEINPRQGRSSYYTTACGHNIAKYIVDDLIYGKEHKFKLVTEEYALSFVPMAIIKRYVESPKLKAELMKLEKEKKIVNPLDCKLDKSLYRSWLLLLRKINYIKKYRENKW